MLQCPPRIRMAEPLGLVSACVLFAFFGTAPAAGLSLQPGLAFTAALQGDSGTFPPDTMGSVGRDHVVVFVNGLYRSFEKSTGTVVEDKTSRQFWSDAGIQSFDNFDPRIVYDPFAERWYAVEAGDRRSSSSRFLFAVSSQADPTRGWTGFAIDGDSTDENWVDFPMLGFDRDTVIVTANMLEIEETSLTGIAATAILVLPKEDLGAPTPGIQNATFFENVSQNDVFFTPQLALDLDDAGAPAPVVAASGFAGAIQLARVAGTATEPVLEGLGPGAFLSLDPGDGGTPAPAPQPDAALPLDTGDAVFQSRLVLRNGSLWGARMINLDGRIAVQWLEIDPETRTLLQLGVVSDPTLDFLYPSIAVNENEEVVIGFSGVGEDRFASAFAVLGETVAGVTSFDDPILLREGTDTLVSTTDPGRARFGDYSATVLDPEDPRVFWTFQEYAEDGNQWAVHVARLEVVPEPAPALVLALGLAALRLRGARR